MSAIRAIYRDGQLQLLDPVNLQNGQTVEVVITMTEAPTPDLREQLREAGHGLLAEEVARFVLPEAPPAELSADALRELSQRFAAAQPLSDLLDEERGTH